MESRKIIIALYLAASGVLWFMTRASIQYLYLTFYHVRRIAGITFIREALPVFLGCLCFAILFKHPRVNLVMEEVISELKKVTWPPRDEVVKATMVVITCILIASFILAGFDVMWGKVIGVLLNTY